jgi:hypothetical protein
MPGAGLALRYGRLSQTAWARKVPEGHRPNPLGDHQADGDVKVDWVARGRHGSDGARLAQGARGNELTVQHRYCDAVRS